MTILHAWIGRYVYQYMFLEFEQGYLRVDLLSDSDEGVMGTLDSPNFWFGYNNKPGPDFDGFELDKDRLDQLNAAWPLGLSAAFKEDIYNWGREVAESVSSGGAPT